MNIGLIISAVFFIIMGLAVLVGLSKGKKYVWQYTLTRLLINVLAVVIAIPITKKIAFIIAKKLGTSAASKFLPTDNAIFTAVPSVSELLYTLMAMLIGLFLFFFVRIIIKNIFKLFVPFLTSVLIHLTEFKREKENAHGSTDAVTAEQADTAGALVDAPSGAQAAAVAAENAKGAPESVIAPRYDGLTDEKSDSKRDGCYALKPQIASVLIAIIGCMLGVIIVFAPFTGLIGLIDNAVSAIDTEMLERENADTEIIYTVKGITSNASVTVSNDFGGRLIFKALTNYKTSKGKISLSREAGLVTSITANAGTLTSDTSGKDAKVDAVNAIISEFEKTSLIPIILSDIINSASEKFNANEEFMGIKPPSYEENGDFGATDKITTEIIHFYNGCTPESIKNDVKTAGKVIAVIIEHDAISKFDTPNELLSDEALISALLTELLSNEHLISLTSTFIEVGILVLEDGLGVTEENEVTVTHKNSVANPETEAKLLAEALTVIFSLSDKIGGDDISSSIASLLTPVGELLDILAATEMVGKTTTDELVLVIFTSDKASSVLPMSNDEIRSFVNSLIEITNRDGGSYTDVMAGISDMVAVLADADASDSASIESVEAALKEITPESAEALMHIVTPEFVSGIGIDDKSAEGVSNLLVNIFDEIANAKKSPLEGGLGLNSQEYEEETAKISEMLETTLSMTDPESEEGLEVGSFASSIMDSKILTNTVINSVYDEEGNVKVDPMGTERELSENEKTELLNTLNSKLDEANAKDYASEAEKESAIEEKERLAVAVGAYMNAALEIENGKVVFK